MNPTTLDFVRELLKLLPAVISGAKEAIAAMTAGRAQVEAMVAEGRDPTDAEWDALHATTAALRKKLHED